jgi:hypothetical protein
MPPKPDIINNQQKLPAKVGDEILWTESPTFDQVAPPFLWFSIISTRALLFLFLKCLKSI